MHNGALLYATVQIIVSVSSVWLAPRLGITHARSRSRFVSLVYRCVYTKKKLRDCVSAVIPRVAFLIRANRSIVTNHRSVIDPRSGDTRDCATRLRNDSGECVSPGEPEKRGMTGRGGGGGGYFERVVTRAYRSRLIVTSIDVEILVALVPQMDFVSGSEIVTTIRCTRRCVKSLISRDVYLPLQKRIMHETARFRIKRV